MIRSAAHADWDARVEILRLEQQRLTAPAWTILGEQMAAAARAMNRFADNYRATKHRETITRADWVRKIVAETRAGTW